MSIDLCFNKELKETQNNNELPECTKCQGYTTNCPYYIPRPADTEPQPYGVIFDWALDAGD